ncbi:MAG TPA: hypothetical protein VME42_19665 [Steroidobacteraceae bacterium]|nr:hypothetical protein [Steroidobacteraceae bacterium]
MAEPFNLVIDRCRLKYPGDHAAFPAQIGWDAVMSDWRADSNADNIADLERSYLAKSGNDLGHGCQLSI